MRSAPPTPDEQARLQALYDYDVLDTDAESVFDDLTRLASEICDTPIALISLVDPDRQWFKSKVGIDAEETSRDIAFCAHAIHEREVFEVKDTHEDDRFVDNPLVTGDPNIRFYAGAQLVTPDGYAIGTLCAISDTPKTLTEQQRSALEILSREVISQLELRRHIKQLKRADERKTEFLSNISHELRTPLNAIISFSQVMLDEIKSGKASSDFLQYLNHLDYSGKRLLELVNSVLDLGKIEQGKMEVQLSEINSAEFFTSIEGMMSVRAEHAKVTFTLTVDPSVSEHIYLDETKLGQILLNLISNAIKFTAAGKQVQVKIFERDNALSLVVQDQGVGISKADQKKLFNKFQQVGVHRAEEGTGLGLVITKSLVELMEGSIKLTSTPDVGTLVKVDLPLPTKPQRLDFVQRQFVSAQYAQDRKILVVEDNLINQEVAKAVFTSLGLSIDVVTTGEECLEYVAAQVPDLIFMDLHLPGISGYQAASEVNQAHPELPIVALSADAFIEKDPKLAAAGMHHYVAKPIEKQRLIAVLNGLIPAE